VFLLVWSRAPVFFRVRVVVYFMAFEHSELLEVKAVQ